MEQRTTEWFKAREGRITGSAVGAILGLSPWSTPDDVMRRMVREYHGQESEFKGNSATEYGQGMEEHAIGDFELETGLTVESAPFIQWEEDWLGASPDGYINGGSLIEVKCPYGLRNQSPTMFKSIDEQPYYYAQMQIQMLVTDRYTCYFWQWSPHGHRLETVNFDPQWIEENLPKLREFYALYLSEREFPQAHKYIDGGELVMRYRRAQAMLDVAKSDLEEARQDLIESTDYKGGKVGDVQITLVKKKGNISYQKAVKDLLPDADLEPYRGKNSEYWRVS